MAIQTNQLNEDHERRFGGIGRLYGDEVRLLLHDKHIAIVGVGGVGSWAVEALARSGLGNLTLIDLDQVAVSNMNRQVQALDSTLGKAKVLALEQRIRDINPDCTVNTLEDFVQPENVGEFFPAGAFDVVIDACDNLRAKIALIIQARNSKIPLIVCGAAGGKSNPLNLRQSDLKDTVNDALLARIRRQIRKEQAILPHKNGKLGVTCLYLDEPSRRTTSCNTNNLSCSGYGSVVTVTASMGFAAASWCLNYLTKPCYPRN